MHATIQVYQMAHDKWEIFVTDAERVLEHTLVNSAVELAITVASYQFEYNTKHKVSAKQRITA
jgi:hypothetical protein